MLGVYTFRLPSSLVNKLGGAKKTSFIGFFLSGLLVGIFAAPCIGPPIIALLTLVGTRGDPVYGFWVFFVLSMGLGAPYLVLGTFSGLIHKLPRSGAWLVWIERLFGVLLLTLAAFFLALAFYPEGIRYVLPAAMILGGAYLGFLLRSKEETQTFKGFKRAFGVVLVSIGILHLMFSPGETLAWEPYTPEKLQAAKAENRPVILDFYADWCIPCHELERFTYSDPRVIEALDHYARLKVDLTYPDSPESKRLLREFDVSGVPAVLFLDRKGKEIRSARIDGFVPPREFLAIIRSPPMTVSSE